MLKTCLVFSKSEPQCAYKKHVIKQERQRERQISEINMALGKYGR